MTRQSPSSTLTQDDLEAIERIIYKASDDIAVSTSRGFERLEEMMDAMEARLYTRLVDIEDLLAQIRLKQADKEGSPSIV